MSERRLIAIDAEAVEEVRRLELDIRTYANYLERHQQMPDLAAGIRREATALRNILAAWDEGVEIPDPARSQSPIRFLPVWVSEGEAQHCLDVLRELAVNLRVFSLFEYAVEEEPRRTFEQMQAEQEVARKLTDPAPQEAE